MKDDRWAGLEPFLEVAATGSFTAAAARLGLSVSHVSRAIAALEARLGVTLLTRTTRRVDMTDAGRILAERGARMIADREATFDAVAQASGRIEGRIRITCPVAYGEAVVAPLVNAFLTLHPLLSVSVMLSNAVLDLGAGDVDLAIRIGGDVDDPRLRAVRLGSRTLRICGGPAYLRRNGTPTDPAALSGHDCVTGSAERWRFSVDGREVLVRPRGRLRCNSGSAVRDAAIRDLGLCQLPDHYVADAIDCGALVEVLSDFRPPDQGIWAVHPRQDAPHRVLALLDHIRGGLA